MGGIPRVNSNLVQNSDSELLNRIVIIVSYRLLQFCEINSQTYERYP